MKSYRRRHLLAGRSEATPHTLGGAQRRPRFSGEAGTLAHCEAYPKIFPQNHVFCPYMHKYTQKHDFSNFQNFRFFSIFAHFWCWCQSGFGYRLLYLKNFSSSQISKIPKKHISTLFWILNRYSRSNELYRPPFFRILKKAILAKIEMTRV